jgi:subtilase family serine protease
MRKSTALVVSLISLTALLLASGGAAGGSAGNRPVRDHGRGHWFVRACGEPGSEFGTCGAQVVTNDTGTPLAASGAPAPGSYGPAQFHTAYGLPTTAPSVQTIAIVDAYDDPNAEADLGVYRSYFGLPACTTLNGCFLQVNQYGVPLTSSARGLGLAPPGNVGWAQEISLDVDMASAICPRCRILLVEADSASILDLAIAVRTAVDLGATEVSNSYGAPEFNQEEAFEGAYTHPGVVVTASSGDSGYGTMYPAASAGVVAVGGTRLVTAANARGWTETAWSGAGSGCSSRIPKPPWQSDTGCAKRMIADVSAVADPGTGVSVYDTYGSGGWLVFGGTSVSAPIVAGVYALNGHPGTPPVPGAAWPYLSPGRLNDVTSGSNGSCSPSYYCTAGPGYDGPTGLGTPKGVGAFGPPV